MHHHNSSSKRIRWLIGLSIYTASLPLYAPALNKAYKVLLNGKTIVLFGEHHNPTGGERFAGGYTIQQIKDKQDPAFTRFVEIDLKGSKIKPKFYIEFGDSHKQSYQNFIRRMPPPFTFSLLRAVVPQAVIWTRFKYAYAYPEAFADIKLTDYFKTIENFDTRDQVNTDVIFAVAEFDSFIYTAALVNAELRLEHFNKEAVLKSNRYQQARQRCLNSNYNISLSMHGKDWFDVTVARVQESLKRLEAAVPSFLASLVRQEAEYKTKEIKDFLLQIMPNTDCRFLIQSMINAFEGDKTNLFVTPEGDVIQLWFYFFAEFSALYMDIDLLAKLYHDKDPFIIIYGGYMHIDQIVKFLSFMGAQAVELDLFNRKMIDDSEYLYQQLKSLLPVEALPSGSPDLNLRSDLISSLKNLTQALHALEKRLIRQP